MRLLLIPLLILSSCANWKQKDFKKELEKSKEVEASVELDPDLQKKFEVKEVEPEPVAEKVAEAPRPAPTKKAKEKSKAVKVPPATKPQPTAPQPAKAVTPEKAAEAPKPAIPADYPPELLSVNEKAKKVWDQYKPNHPVNEKRYLDIHYLGMTVGKIMFVNKGKRMINGKEVWHFHARFKSAPFYSSIYELDDTIDTYVTTDQFLSTRFSLVQRESKQDIDDLQLHDRDALKTHWYYKQKKSDGTLRNKQKNGYLPYFSTDPFSVLFLYQGLPLKDGDVLEIPIVNKAKTLVLRSHVEGRETIETEKGKRKAIRIHATTKYTGEHLKDGDMYFWISDDEKRILLKAKAKIKIGSVTADIVDG